MNQAYFRFIALTPDGQRAYQGYEHISSYLDGCVTQYERVYEVWRETSAIQVTIHDQAGFMDKWRRMQQVIRDIHYLLVSLQVVWKTVQRMCDPVLYPHFVPLSLLRDKWAPYFEQYREPRNTFEHFDDQVLGPDTRGNSPGYGVSLAPDGGFSLGSQQSVYVNTESHEQLLCFKAELNACFESIIGPEA
jgi:hypothetical protein